MAAFFSLMEARRASDGKGAPELDCPGGAVRFRLEAVDVPDIARSITPVTAENRAAVNDFILSRWYALTMMIRGRAVDMTGVDGFLLADGGRILGLVTYYMEDAACEIASLDAVIENAGIGTALLARAEDAARKAGCRVVRLVTTNDNVHAIRFYQKRGFDLAGLDRGAVDRARARKPEIPLLGEDGIPLRHEIELVKTLAEENTPLSLST